MSQSVNRRLQRESELLWHPYSSLTEPSPVRLVRGASGVRLRLDDGAGGVVEAIDAMSSWWSRSTATATRCSTRRRSDSWTG